MIARPLAAAMTGLAVQAFSSTAFQRSSVNAANNLDGFDAPRPRQTTRVVTRRETYELQFREAVNRFANFCADRTKAEDAYDQVVALSNVMSKEQLAKLLQQYPDANVLAINGEGHNRALYGAMEKGPCRQCLA